MDLVFRKLSRGAAPAAAAAGEVLLLPADLTQQDRRDLAMLVYEQGLNALVHGEGMPRTLVLDVEPTLDDMVAALWLTRLAQNKLLPAGGKVFCRYAALVREGLRPTDFPLENTLEGIYLALRNSAGDDLTQAETAHRFVDDWQRLAERILQAAENNVDPFQTSLFPTKSDFARERSFLVRDYDVYAQDVKNGQTWKINLPGRPAPALGLLLRQPKSLLFKYWSRQRMEGAKEPYLLLAVQWDKGQWVFSTDPVFRVSLKPLAELLQAAEKAREAAQATKDPWFDGKPFGHTLIGAPRGGSRLDDCTIVRLVQRWTGARVLGARTLPQKLALGAALAVLLLGLAAWPFLHVGDSGVPRLRALRPIDDTGSTVSANKPRTLHVLAIGVSKYKDAQFDLGYAAADAKAVAKALKTHAAQLFDTVDTTMLLDRAATREAIIDELNALKKRVGTNDLVVVSISGHGDNLDRQDNFFFLPHDYNEGKRASSGVYWDDLKRFLDQMPCNVFLVMDTCHSGTITGNLPGTRDIKLKEGKGLVVLAACLSEGTAAESQEWGHGALTLAFLEAIAGRHLFTGRSATRLPESAGDLSINDLVHYVKNRVAELAPRQPVVANQTGNIADQGIFLAKRSEKK